MLGNYEETSTFIGSTLGETNHQNVPENSTKARKGEVSSNPAIDFQRRGLENFEMDLQLTNSGLDATLLPNRQDRMDEISFKGVLSHIHVRMSTHPK